MALSRLVKIAGQDVVFREIEFSVFRNDDVESSVVVDNDRTEGFYGAFESLGNFFVRQPSDFPSVRRHVHDVLGQTLALVHVDDVHPLFRLRPEHPYFVVGGIELLKGRIRFLSPFLKLGHRDEKVVRIFRIPDVEGEDSFASGIPVDFQDDVPSDAEFAFKEIAKYSRIRLLRDERKNHFRNMHIASAHFSPVCGESLRSKEIQSEVVSVEHFDSERGREIGFEESQVFLLDPFDSGNEDFRVVFKTFETFVRAAPVVRSGFRDVYVRGNYGAELRIIREPLREHVERIYRTYGELLVSDRVRFDVSKHGVIPISVIPSNFREPFFREGRD